MAVEAGCHNPTETAAFVVISTPLESPHATTIRTGHQTDRIYGAPLLQHAIYRPLHPPPPSPRPQVPLYALQGLTSLTSLKKLQYSEVSGAVTQ